MVWSSYNTDMQVSVRSLNQTPIISVVIGGPIGCITGVIFDPSTMKVLFMTVQLPKNQAEFYLPVNQTRDITPQHVVIDSEANLSRAEELVRYTEILKHPVTLIGYKVVTASGKPLGSCYDCIFDNTLLALAKIYVKAGWWQRLLINHHIIDVTDVVRIEAKRIVVRDAIVSELRRAKNVLPAQSS